MSLIWTGFLPAIIYGHPMSGKRQRKGVWPGPTATSVLCRLKSVLSDMINGRFYQGFPSFNEMCLISMWCAAAHCVFHLSFLHLLCISSVFVTIKSGAHFKTEIIRKLYFKNNCEFWTQNSSSIFTCPYVCMCSSVTFLFLFFQTLSSRNISHGIQCPQSMSPMPTSPPMNRIISQTFFPLGPL